MNENNGTAYGKAVRKSALVVVFGIDAVWSCISPNTGAGVTEGSGGKAQTEVTTGA